jgi:hypothetical protein
MTNTDINPNAAAAARRAAETNAMTFLPPLHAPRPTVKRSTPRSTHRRRSIR